MICSPRRLLFTPHFACRAMPCCRSTRAPAIRAPHDARKIMMPIYAISLPIEDFADSFDCYRRCLFHFRFHFLLSQTFFARHASFHFSFTLPPPKFHIFIFLLPAGLMLLLFALHASPFLRYLLLHHCHRLHWLHAVSSPPPSLVSPP